MMGEILEGRVLGKGSRERRQIKRNWL